MDSFKEKYFILNEYGTFEYIGEFEEFSDADDFCNSDDFRGQSIWIFNEDSIAGIEESIKKVKENMHGKQ